MQKSALYFASFAFLGLMTAEPSTAETLQRQTKIDVFELLSYKGVAMPPRSYEALRREGRVNHLFIGEDHSVWFGTAQHLWHWDLGKNKLQRSRVLRRSDFMRALATDGLQIYAAGDEQVVEINADFTLRNRYQPFSPGQTNGFIPITDQVIWMHSTGEMALDRYEKTPLKVKLKLASGESILKSAFDPVSGLVWLLTDKAVYRTSKSFSQVEHLQSHNGEIQNLGIGSGHVYLVYKKRTEVYAMASHKLIQNIPAASDKTILASHFSKEAHTFLLSDGLVEVFDLKEEKTYRYLLLVDQLRNIGNFQRQSRTVAFTSLGRPFVFQLSKPLDSSRL